MGAGPGGGDVSNWLFDEMERASAESRAMPEWAKPVVTHGRFRPVSDLSEAIDHLADLGIVAGDDDAHAIRVVLDALELRQLREDRVRALAESTLERCVSSSAPWATALAREILATVGRSASHED